ncbi:MAG TPA: tripartite tricarboxylate transporter TctB family protein [Alphaproteobacteria bacterium]|nr:tripartite tricarboxylate transporter TctB family protein [Alphaproteobacteria bacterium]
MLRRLIHKRDFYAGGLLILFGLLAALKGPDYGPGTLMHMGPGFMPTALGVILILLGLAIAGSSLASPDGVDEQILPDHPQWFAWGCILASPLMFIIFGTYFGMFPGTFMCIFVAALGDKTQTYKSAVGLALIVGVAGTALFSYLLQVPMPILTWPGGGL